MNKEITKWAFTPSTPAVNKAVQTIAFRYGYNWLGASSKSTILYHTDVKVLYFNPDTKWITYSKDIEEKDVSNVVSTLEEAVELFENPPVIQSFKLGPFTISKDGSVTMFNGCNEVKIDFDKLAACRSLFLSTGKIS
jgi:hypothetical protein